MPPDAQTAVGQSQIYLLGTDPANAAVTATMRSRFRAHGQRNASAARSAERFLTEHARDDGSTHTRVFVLDGGIIGFYAMSVGEASLTGRARQRLRVRASNNRIPTAHVDWIARAEGAPQGTGWEILLHAVAVVTDDLQPVTPILAMSLDPFDAATAKAWQNRGFKSTTTQVAGGECRLFLPLSGYGAMGAADDL